MVTELCKGGIFTKINLKGHLKDITNNEITKINTSGIQQQKKLSFYLDNDRYILKIISPTKLILTRTNDEINSNIYFEENKILPALYTIKENDLSLEIDIKTESINLTDNYIRISYTVIDSNTKYEYYIEMSEYK